MTNPNPAPSPAPTPAPAPTVPSQNLLTKFALCIQQYEGFIPAGGNDGGGTKFPTGSPAWRYHNPGNIFSINGVKGDLAIDIAPSGENIYPDYTTGFQALKNQIVFDISGKSRVYGPHCGNMTILDYMKIYSPAPENDPIKYAAYIARQLNVNAQTFIMRNLLS